jgi:hypothetical protein
MLEGDAGRTKRDRVWGVGGDCCRSRTACEVRVRRGGAHLRTDARRRGSLGARVHQWPAPTGAQGGRSGTRCSRTREVRAREESVVRRWCWLCRREASEDVRAREPSGALEASLGAGAHPAAERRVAERKPTAEGAASARGFDPTFFTLPQVASSAYERLHDEGWARGEQERPRARAGPDSKGEASVGAKRAPGGWAPTQRGLGAALLANARGASKRRIGSEEMVLAVQA